jgi:hypothetical protein
MLLCCWMYIPDLPTYLVVYFETTHGSSIDIPTTMTTMTTALTHFKSFYIPDCIALKEVLQGCISSLSLGNFCCCEMVYFVLLAAICKHCIHCNVVS